MKWMDVGIRLEPWCNGSPCPGTVRLLEVLPNETRGGTLTSVPAQVAGALTDTAKLTAPFFPATTFEDKLSAGSGGLAILFNNLFPPKTLTFFHAYIDSPERFGWNFRQNKQKPEEASIMGLHRGIVLLEANKAVTEIGVRYAALSEWDRKVNSENTRIDLREGADCVTLPSEKAESPIEYDKLADLSRFPILIEKAKVLQILHITETQYDHLVETDRLETTPGLAYVKRASLEKYLGLVKKEKEKDKQDNSQ